MDDIVVYGRPSVDERMISGELVPVERTERDRVTATTINGTAPTETAAQGCSAARRLELTIRPLDGIDPWGAPVAALSDTQTGIDWSGQCKHYSP